MDSVKAVSAFCKESIGFKNTKSEDEFTMLLGHRVGGASGQSFSCKFCLKEYAISNKLTDSIKRHLTSCKTFKDLHKKGGVFEILNRPVRRLSLPSGTESPGFSSCSTEPIFTCEAGTQPQLYYNELTQSAILAHQQPKDPNFKAVGYLKKLDIEKSNSPSSELTNKQKRSLSTEDLLANEDSDQIHKRIAENLLMSPTKKSHEQGHLMKIQDDINAGQNLKIGQIRQFFAKKSIAANEVEPEKYISYICKLCINKCNTVKESSERTCLLEHLKSEQHKQKCEEFLKENWRFPYFQNHYDFEHYKTMTEESTAAEGSMAIFAVKTGIPFRTMSELSLLIRNTRLNANFHCAEAKLAALIKVTLNRYAFEQLKKDLKKAQYVSIQQDTTTLHNTKILSLTVKFWDPVDGVQVRFLGFRSLVGETSEDICEAITQAMTQAELPKTKVIAMVADNTNTNFGGPRHVEKNNVATRLDKALGHGTYRLGCEAHIGHNSFRRSIEKIKDQFNVALAITQVFKYFDDKVKLRQEFENFWTGDLGKRIEDLKPLRGFCETRWLSAALALIPLDEMFVPLREFFTAKIKNEKATAEATKLAEWFASNMNYCWIGLVKLFAMKCSAVAASIQGRSCTIMSGLKVINELLEFCSTDNRKKSLIYLLHDNEMNKRLKLISKPERKILRKGANDLLNTCKNYLTKWLEPFGDLEAFSWASLNSNIISHEVHKAIQEFYGRISKDPKSQIPFNVDTKALHREINFINEVIINWSNEELERHTSEKWVDVFATAQAQEPPVDLALIKPLICGIMAMSPSNALSESIFSEIGHFWDDSKSNIDFVAIAAFINIRYNLRATPTEFQKIILDDDNLRKDITSTDKYRDMKIHKINYGQMTADLENPSVPQKIDKEIAIEFLKTVATKEKEDLDDSGEEEEKEELSSDSETDSILDSDSDVDVDSNSDTETDSESSDSE